MTFYTEKYMETWLMASKFLDKVSEPHSCSKETKILWKGFLIH